MQDASFQDILSNIRDLAKAQPRVLVAIAGPPASGKSTLAERLKQDLGANAVVLPMDGFHLDNDRLRKMGLLHRKGAPQTFDAKGFVALLRQVRSQRHVSFPTFDRDQDRTLADTGAVHDTTNVVLVEGNYLLLDVAPWSDLAGLFDFSICLDVDANDLEARLIARWIDHGLTPEDARARAIGNDMKNVQFVQDNARPANVVLRSGKA